MRGGGRVATDWPHRQVATSPPLAPSGRFRWHDFGNRTPHRTSRLHDSYRTAQIIAHPHTSHSPRLGLEGGDEMGGAHGSPAEEVP